MNTPPRPPAQVAPYVEALGTDLAVTFLLHFGGADLYIPADPKGASEIVRVLGWDGARALSALAQRVKLQYRVPLAKPWLAQHMSITEGLSKSEIARRLHVAVPTVTRYLADTGPKAFPEPAQLSLDLASPHTVADEFPTSKLRKMTR